MSTVRVTLDVATSPEAALAALLDELQTALHLRGMALEGGPDGTVRQGDAVLGRVVEWRPGEGAVLTWRPAPWAPDEETRLEIRTDAVEGGSRITVEQQGWDTVLGDAGDAVGWFASEVAARLIEATAPDGLGDWLTDRQARRPSGETSRATYREPLYHYPGFRVVLDELSLTPADHLLEIGCGGGAFLAEALKSGCRAAAVDHSPQMVRVARETNRDAIAEGRLDIREASATPLPFADDIFTCATMTGVLGFLSDPVAALSEIRRVLGPGGRIVIMGSDPELKGTPAAPEPMASRLHFYEAGRLEELGRSAGFTDVHVVRRAMESFAREVGVPEEHLPLFAAGGTFLLGRTE